MYEIRKRSTVEKDVWFTIAISDTWKWASEISGSMNCAGSGEFSVFKDGEMIMTGREVMGRD